MKIDKTRLRAAAWQTPDVHWRAGRNEPLRPLTDADRATLDPLLP